MDYIFYRIFLFYKNRDEIPKLSAIFFLSVVKLSFFFLFCVVINLLSGGLFSNQNMDKKMFVIFFFGILSFVFILDLFRYFKNKKVKELLKKFENSSLNRKIKTWQIFILPILVVLTSILLIVVAK
ncbi:hypothetical protein [Flavobacterium tegetincola]|uniref:hypothetical protein n=1 Tax=Flavobacterium tegetincola TaxID=150172 RepID=UPI00047C3E4D|nr:hypothetical protein [Flavobacterium tegetincola]